MTLVEPLEVTTTELLPGAEPFLFDAGPVGCLLIHGFTGTPFELRELGEYLAARDITALGPLLPGHGTTPQDMARTGWRDWYGAVEAALRDLQGRCQVVFVCGLSLGGALTLHLGAHHPELAGIVPLAAPAFIRHRLLHLMPLLKHVIHYYPKGPEDIHDPEARARHVAYKVNPVPCAESLVAFLAHLRDDLPEVRVPALLMQARQDKMVPPECLPYIFERLGSADREMLWLEQGGHPVTVDYDKPIVFERVYQFITARVPETMSFDPTPPADTTTSPAPHRGSRQSEHMFEANIPTAEGNTKSVRLGYLLFLPEGYGNRQAQRWPLILFLHGVGERGSDLTLIKKHGIPRIVEERGDFPFIAVSPQCPQDTLWWDQLEPLSALLDHVIATYAVDPDRVYLTGLSMGGYGTWLLATNYPDRFAAIAPICGGGDPDAVSAIEDVPVWAFHGALDATLPLTESEEMVNALRACGGDVHFTVYPDAEHDSWTRTYENPELYAWFLQHRRQR